MASKQLQVIIRILLGVLISAASTASCTIPLPAPRTLQAPRPTWTATTAPPLTSTAIPTNTPVILVLPTDTPTPVTPTVEPSDTPTIPPTNTLVVIALPTDTPRPSTPTATRVLVMTTEAAAVAETKPSPTATATTQPTSMKPTSTSVMQVITLAPAPSPEPSITAKATTAVAPTRPPIATPTPTVELKPVSPTPTPTMPETSVPAVELAVTMPAVSERPQAMAITPTYEIGDVIANGNFEQGFDESGVGRSWKAFGRASGVYGWSDETWPGLIWDGQHAQMMRILFSSEPDQYVGIQQTVSVVKGETYELTIHGLIRSTEGSAKSSSWGYRVQWGIDQKGRDLWEVVREWYDTGWDDQPLDADSYTINEYKATIVPTQDTLTLFIRGWRKWPTEGHQVDFVIDGVSLVGPMPSGPPMNLPTTGGVILPIDWSRLIIAFGLTNVIFGLRHIRSRLSPVTDK